MSGSAPMQLHKAQAAAARISGWSGPRMATPSRSRSTLWKRFACQLPSRAQIHDSSRQRNFRDSAHNFFHQARLNAGCRPTECDPPIGTQNNDGKVSKKAGRTPGLFWFRPWRVKWRLVLCGHRATPAEAVVYAELDGVFVVAKPRADDGRRAGEEGGIAEIIVLVFAFDRPVRREHVFQTGADGIAVASIVIDGEGRRHASDRDGKIVVVSPGVTALGIEQRRPKGITQSTRHRAKLIGACGRNGIAGEYHPTATIAGEPTVLGFRTDHPIVRELIVEAALHAAQEAGVIGFKAVAAREGSAEMPAEIKAGPVIEDFWRPIHWSLGVGARRY